LSCWWVCNHFVGIEDNIEEELNMEGENNTKMEQNWKDFIHTESSSIVIRVLTCGLQSRIGNCIVTNLAKII